MKASNEVGCGRINVEVCSVSQFSTKQNCDSDSKRICITEDKPFEFCGDNICQANKGETILTCPRDCVDINKNCGVYSDGCLGSLNCGTCGEGFICSFGECVDEPPEPNIKLIMIIAISLIVIFLVIIAVVVVRRRK